MIYRIVKTKWGWCGVAGSGGGICRLYLPVRSKARLKRIISKEFKGAVENRMAFANTSSQLKQYFAGKKIRRWDASSVALQGTDFQRRVWRAAMKIPYGEVRTYGWVAKQIGMPSASRAVGSALGKNPVPLIVPCHRVIRADRSLGGFSAEQGVAFKRRLLELEGLTDRDWRSSVS